MDWSKSERTRAWALQSLLNLAIVALLGVTLRYKLAFSLPSVNYMYLLGAHNQFAFSGWVSLAIFTGFIQLLQDNSVGISRNYRIQFNLYQIANFGMLLSFLYQGYGPVSVVFLFFSILVSYWFALKFWKDLKRSNLPWLVKSCARFALASLVLSYAPILMAHVMPNSQLTGNLYANSIYLFLHFQYNGWFTFGAFAIFFATLGSRGIRFDRVKGGLFFKLLAIASVPAFALSILWTDPPAWVFATAAAAALVQLIAMVVLLSLLYQSNNDIKDQLSRGIRLLWSVSLLAFTTKLILQALSVVPSLGQYAFGRRSVIIAYLHWVLLGFVSMLLIGLFLSSGYFSSFGKAGKTGLAILVTGILINECLLVMQGVGWNPDGNQEFTQIMLFWVSVLILVALILFFVSQFLNRRFLGREMNK